MTHTLEKETHLKTPTLTNMSLWNGWTLSLIRFLYFALAMEYYSNWISFLQFWNYHHSHRKKHFYSIGPHIGRLKYHFQLLYSHFLNTYKHHRYHSWSMKSRKISQMPLMRLNNSFCFVFHISCNFAKETRKLHSSIFEKNHSLSITFF